MKNFLPNALELLGMPMPVEWTRPVFDSITGLDLVSGGILLLLVWILNTVIFALLSRLAKRWERVSSADAWEVVLLRAAQGPLQLVLWTAGLELSALQLLANSSGEEANQFRYWFVRLANWALFAGLVWLFFRATRLLEVRLRHRAAATASTLDDVLIPLLLRSARVMIPLLAVVLAAPLLGLPLTYDGILRKTITLAIVAAVAWVLIQAVLISEKAIKQYYAAQEKDELKTRALFTQVNLLKRILVTVIGIVAVGCILMTFDDVRRVGTSMLASAGLAGVVLGFAAQRVLGNLFAGIQIAFTQPIRLGDGVVVEGEWGNIEEITLTYVVIRIWDLRRLVLPISYFIEKPFQNWTRTSPKVMGTVLLYVDYTQPVDDLRAEAKRIIEPSQNWDGQFWNLQVTDTTEKTMQIRVLVTAADSGKAFNLRCEVREGLIRYLQSNRPASLPRVRFEIARGHRNGLAGPKTIAAARADREAR